MKTESKWTLFWDMCSGGSLSEPPFGYIYIEAPEDEARVIFYNRFGHNPERVSCTCCGEDYSVYESESLEDASAYHRGCKWPTGGKAYDLSSCNISLVDYVAQEDVLVIRAQSIQDTERTGEIPSQGYVWI